MTPLVAKITSLKEERSPLPGLLPAPAYPDGLTQREIDVLRLIAAGKSNQQIADELVISVHTVIYHVRNIFSKTSAANPPKPPPTPYAMV
jgi:DNA-binding NarL/FixJ family response regulator